MSIGRVFRGRRIRAGASAPGILSEDTIALTDVDRERPEKDGIDGILQQTSKGDGRGKSAVEIKVKIKIARK